MITSFFAPKRNSRGNNDKDAHTGKDKNIEANKDAPDQPEQPKRIKLTLDAPLTTQHDAHVQNLLSNLTDPSWNEVLAEYVSKPSFRSLAAFVAKERSNSNSVRIYPPPHDTFTALNLVPFDKVKVVIVGQDPYHGPGQGHGLCFSVKKGVRIPPSLRNIYKELLEHNPECGLNAMPQHGHLERWARQGVLMINSVLTVRQGQANSHKNRGWEEFTDEIIRCLFTKNQKKNQKNQQRQNAKGNGLVFLLWGKPASKKAGAIIDKYSNGYSKSHTHKPVVICSSHPSPLGATKTNAPFIGSRCFSRANAALEKMGMSKIDWNVDGTYEEDEDDIEKDDHEDPADEESSSRPHDVILEDV